MAELALVVSFLALFVNYAQWRTANQKVVVDLYDRRLKAYSQIENAIAGIMREGNVSREAFRAFVVARADARFLLATTSKNACKNYESEFLGLPPSPIK